MMEYDWVKFREGIIPLVRGRKILSIGCGTGISELQYAGEGSLGIDDDWKHVEIARGKGFRVIKAKAQEADLNGEKFEAVTIIHLLCANDQIRSPPQHLCSAVML